MKMKIGYVGNICLVLKKRKFVARTFCVMEHLD